ncbi:hypothetical protein CEXT_307771 [Caerostris extrusa]|uniref:Uncharacterized protein n=1 Tax=Caerostris extrusa TaxID=172846 RepID=A0AAV4UA17_CAEEX|nr:hypothetical protein CEXT_307771 [Caerostris extrusa]
MNQEGSATLNLLSHHIVVQTLPEGSSVEFEAYVRTFQSKHSLSLYTARAQQFWFGFVYQLQIELLQVRNLIRYSLGPSGL